MNATTAAIRVLFSAPATNASRPETSERPPPAIIEDMNEFLHSYPGALVTGGLVGVVLVCACLCMLLRLYRRCCLASTKISKSGHRAVRNTEDSADGDCDDPSSSSGESNNSHGHSKHRPRSRSVRLQDQSATGRSPGLADIIHRGSFEDIGLAILDAGSSQRAGSQRQSARQTNAQRGSLVGDRKAGPARANSFAGGGGGGGSSSRSSSSSLQGYDVFSSSRRASSRRDKPRPDARGYPTGGSFPVPAILSPPVRRLSRPKSDGETPQADLDAASQSWQQQQQTGDKRAVRRQFKQPRSSPVSPRKQTTRALAVDKPPAPPVDNYVPLALLAANQRALQAVSQDARQSAPSREPARTPATPRITESALRPEDAGGGGGEIEGDESAAAGPAKPQTSVAKFMQKLAFWKKRPTDGPHSPTFEDIP